MKKSGTALIVACIGLTGATVTLASPTDRALHARLHANAVKEMSQAEWSSACHLAENGLGAVIEARVAEEGSVELMTHYFLDTRCTRSAGMQARASAALKPVEGLLNHYELESLGASLVRTLDRLVYRHGAHVIHLAKRGGES